MTEIRLYIEIITKFAAVCADFIGGGVRKGVNLVALGLFLGRPRLFVKIFILRGGVEKIIKITHKLSLL